MKRDGDAEVMGHRRASQAGTSCIDFEAVLSVQTGGILDKPKGNAMNYREMRCKTWNKLLCKGNGTVEIKCCRCKNINRFN